MSVDHKNVYFDVLTPVNFLSRSASIFADKVAVVYEDKRYTYQEFYNRVNRLADALRKVGIGKDDKVAFMCPNIPAMLEAHYAVPMIGAALVSINIRLSSREVGYIINHSDSKVILVDNEFAHVIKSIMKDLTNITTVVNICDVSDEMPLTGMEYEQFLQTGSDAPIEPVVEDEYQLATINYTSGTTGLPKGVMYHHRGAYLNALGEAVEFSLNSQSNYLWTLPMFHCNGWCFTWAVTAVGGTHVCLRRVVADEIYRVIERESISHLCAAPTILIGMANFPGAKDIKFKRQLNVITAGAPPAPTVIKNMESLGVDVTQVYGLTETYGPHSICEWQAKWDGLSVDEKVGIKARQGVPYVHAQHMDVVDVAEPLTMKSVPRDAKTIGEIVMRGNNVMLGYYKDSGATDEAFAGGWFHSGDLAVVHPDSYVQIMDRKKDIIISGGENISTVEVESVIFQHPDVLEVAVIAVPDDKWGEVPKAFVVPKTGTNPTEQEIIDHCKQNLARFKAPKSVQFGELPKTATGKIMKFKLREIEWAGKELRVN
ncbi:MAG: acyl--CoA ligase family protein [Syntrophobacteraceae bacterium]